MTNLDKSLLAERLKSGLAAMALSVPAEAQEKLIAYIELLLRWSRTYNLTAIRDPEGILTHHILDSLAALPVLGKSALAGRRLRVADVGSGAGLPGIPWAITMPEWAISSIEAVAKKAAFQQQVCIDLGLKNLTVLKSRVEHLPSGGYDLVTSRAFSSLADFAGGAGHLLDTNGLLYALKGQRPDNELAELPAPWCLDQIHEVHVPGLNAQRHVLILRRG